MKPPLIPMQIAALLAAVTTALPAEPKTTWNGFQRVNFSVEGQACFITQPAVPAPGKPWVWRTSFPDFHAEVDLELLRNGWAIGYIECLDLLGCDAALDLMDGFYTHMIRERGFARKPALETVSRGGLHAYRYAARHPDRIACGTDQEAQVQVLIPGGVLPRHPFGVWLAL